MKSVFLGCYSKDYNFTNEKGSFSGTSYYLIHGEIRENKVNYPVKQKVNKIIYDNIKSFPFGTPITVDYIPIGNDMRIDSVTKL